MAPPERRYGGLVFTLLVTVFASNCAYQDQHPRVRWQSGELVEFIGLENVVLQRNSHDCGVAALGTLALSVGWSLDLPDIRSRLPPASVGLTMLTLRDIAADNGIGLRGVRVNPQNALVVDTPSIAHLSGHPGHFVVVERIEGSYWIIVDPAIGRLRVRDTRFRRSWSGNTLVLAASGTAAHPPPRSQPHVWPARSTP